MPKTRLSHDDLYFEGGRLVKIRGSRPEYLSGDVLILLLREVAELLYTPIVPRVHEPDCQCPICWNRSHAS